MFVEPPVFSTSKLIFIGCLQFIYMHILMKLHTSDPWSGHSGGTCMGGLWLQPSWKEISGK